MLFNFLTLKVYIYRLHNFILRSSLVVKYLSSLFCEGDYVCQYVSMCTLRYINICGKNKKQNQLFVRKGVKKMNLLPVECGEGRRWLSGESLHQEKNNEMHKTCEAYIYVFSALLQTFLDLIQKSIGSEW